MLSNIHRESYEAQKFRVASRKLRFYSRSYVIYIATYLIVMVSRLFVKVMRLFAKSIFKAKNMSSVSFCCCIFFVKFKNQPYFTEKKKQ